MFLTDSGLETTLIFHEGIELPFFAAFDLLKTDEGVRKLRRYYARHAAIAEAYGVGFILESPTWRANADWVKNSATRRQSWRRRIARPSSS
jgi:hypothetical protein